MVVATVLGIYWNDLVADALNRPAFRIFRNYHFDFDSCHRHFTCIQQPLLHITWITMLGEYAVAAQEQTAIHFFWVVSVTLCHSSCREAHIQANFKIVNFVWLRYYCLALCDIQCMHNSILFYLWCFLILYINVVFACLCHGHEQIK